MLVEARAGDIILWDSRTIHGGHVGPGLAADPNGAEKPQANAGGGGSAPLPPRKRPIFISCSSLGRQWRQIPEAVLRDALFFFGSKRKWLFPDGAAETREAQRQPGRYHLLDRDFVALVRAKEARGEVHFTLCN